MTKNMFFKRNILEKIKKSLSNRKILILLGARQTGKTSILKLLLNELPSERSVFIDLDLLSNRSIFDNELELIYYLKNRGYKENDKEKFYLIVDEFQNVENSTIIFKSIYDNYNNIKIIASGSSSLRIKKRISETMAGRIIVFKVNPLTFDEFLRFKTREDLANALNQENISKRILIELKKYFNEFIVYGSYPEVSLTEKREQKIEILNSIFEFYIEKDIRLFMNIRNIRNFKNLLEHLAVSTGNIIKYNNIANDLGINVQTVRDYISTIEDTFLIKLLPPCSLNRINSLKKSNKIYFIDTGLRNYLLKNFNENLRLRVDSGVLLESFVFSELYKRLKLNQELYFFRTRQGSEIDFIFKKENEIFLLEVKKVAKRLPRIFNEFKNYKHYIISEEASSKKTSEKFLLIYNFYNKVS